MIVNSSNFLVWDFFKIYFISILKMGRRHKQNFCQPTCQPTCQVQCQNVVKTVQFTGTLSQPGQTSILLVPSQPLNFGCSCVIQSLTVSHLNTAFLVTSTNTLVSVNLQTPSIVTQRPIVGLVGVPAETSIGIDFRPANGLLYLATRDATNTGRIYILNPNTGSVTFVSVLSVLLSGTLFGVDFNPVPDRLRIVSDTTQNLRVNVDTGAVTVDTPLSAAGVAGAAYTNNFAGTTATTLYDINTTAGTLVLQGGINGVPSPNLGQLTTVGPLGVVPTNAAFDIVTNGGINSAFGILTVAGVPGLYTVNLSTGTATLIGQIPGIGTVNGLAIPPPVTLQANLQVNGTLNNIFVSIPAVAGSTSTVTVPTSIPGTNCNTVTIFISNPTGTLPAFGSIQATLTLLCAEQLQC